MATIYAYNELVQLEINIIVLPCWEPKVCFAYNKRKKFFRYRYKKSSLLCNGSLLSTNSGNKQVMAQLFIK
jgi:hypothetical protein